MAIIPVVPIGSPRESFCDARTFRAHRDKLTELEDLLRERRAEVRRGWGDKYIARVHSKGKLTSRERIDRLRDPDSELLEVGTFVNYGREFGDKGLRSPAAGVVTAFARLVAAGQIAVG